MKILANRLKRIITNYIQPDQKRFMPNRQLSDKSCRPLNIITYCKYKKIEAIALSMDLEKAFDSVNLKYLQHIDQHVLW